MPGVAMPRTGLARHVACRRARPAKLFLTEGLRGVRFTHLGSLPGPDLPPSAPVPQPALATMAAPAATSLRIGDLLIREGLITKEQLEKALQEQKQNGTRVGYNLVKLGFIAETELTKMLARQFKMPAVDLSRFEVDPRIAKLIPADLAVKHLVLPLKRGGRTLTVAMADPTNRGVLDDLKFVPPYDIFPVIGGEFTLKSAIDKLYENNTENQVADLLSVIDDMEGDIEIMEEKEEDVAASALAAQMED